MPQYKTLTCDVLVIGSGGAGLRAAIELHDNDVDVLVVGKCKKGDAHTIEATGGINAALSNMDPKDSWQLHAADTIRDGGHINDTDAVILLCKNAPRAIHELAKWGTPFARERNEKISQRFFGAALYRRACFVGDRTGRAILETLVEQVEKRKIGFKSEVYITSLLHHKGRVNGALGIEMHTGKFIIFHAKLVVLATGGHSRMFAWSSSRFWENNGDGIALAAELGAQAMDMEMFQYHPTGMVYPAEAEGVLVTEAVRGEGGILTNAKGERFMKKYDPKRMELSARDVVARAIYMEVAAGRGTKRGGVWLDISHLPKAYIVKRLPLMYEQFRKYNKVDISKQKMEVAPTAHYSMGGLLTDQTKGTTTVPGLYAVGEVTSGVHGGNRLGGNSLAEIMVFGRLSGQHAATISKKTIRLPLDLHLAEQKMNEVRALTQKKTSALSALNPRLAWSTVKPLEAKKKLQAMMWQRVGVIRNGKDMKRALTELNRFKQMHVAAPGTIGNNQQLIAALNFRNMLSICEMIIKSALFRTESRAAHYRSDYLKTSPKWKRTIVCTPTKHGAKLSTRPVKKVPANIQRLIDWTEKRRSTKLLE